MNKSALEQNFLPKNVQRGNQIEKKLYHPKIYKSGKRKFLKFEYLLKFFQSSNFERIL